MSLHQTLNVMNTPKVNPIPASNEADSLNLNPLNHYIMNIPIGVYKILRTGEVILANPALYKMLGCNSPSDLNQMDLTHQGFLDPDNQKKFFNLLQTGSSKTIETYRKQKNGSWIFVREQIHVIFDEDHQQIAYEGIVEDITHIRRNDALTAAIYKISISANSTNTIQDFIREVYSILNNIIVTGYLYVATCNESSDEASQDEATYLKDSSPPLDIDTVTEQSLNKIQFPSIPYLFGESDLQHIQHDLSILAQFMFQLHKPLLLKSQDIAELISSGKINWIHEIPHEWIGIPFVVKNNKIIGALIAYNNSAISYSEKDVEILTLIATQVAEAIENKYWEEALKASEKKLRKTNLSKDTFFSIIAHDIKSPLSSFKQVADFLSKNLLKLNEEQAQKFLNLLGQSANQLHELLENLLEWSRSQMGILVYNPEILDIKRITESAIALFSYQTSKKKLSVISHIQENTYIFADLYMITTIIRNLLSNAIKFTPLHGVVEVFCTESDDCFELCVSDTGVGIAKEDLDKIFRIDLKHTTEGTDHEKGSGLGLILCQELIKKHGGKLRVQTELYKGSCFYITIPKTS